LWTSGRLHTYFCPISAYDLQDKGSATFIIKNLTAN